MTVTAVDERLLLKLQADAGLPLPPTQDTYWYRMAIAGEGTHAYDWTDKPHRLVYDLRRLLEAQTPELLAARKEIAGLREGLEPFAALADDYIENDMDRDDTPMAGRMTGPLNGLTPIGAVVKFADFRRARNLIAGGNSNE